MNKQNLKFILGLSVLVFSTSFFLLSCMGCGGVNNKKLGDIEKENNPINETADSILKLGQTKSNAIEKLLNRNLKNKEIVASDSTYAIVFFNENGDSLGKYDIWENNPFNDLPFEVKNALSGRKPLRYSVPNIPKEEFKRMFTHYPVEFMDESVSVGRVDIFAILPSSLEISKYSNYLPVTYQMNMMEGFSEEYDVPASYGIINILDKTGKIVESIEISNLGGNKSAVTQDGKFLAYTRVSHKLENSVFFEVYNLTSQKIIWQNYASKSNVLHGPFLNNPEIISFGEHDPLHKNPSIAHWISSIDDAIYYDTLPPRFGNYRVSKIGLIKPMKGYPSDTLLFKDFNTVNLK